MAKAFPPQVFRKGSWIISQRNNREKLWLGDRYDKTNGFFGTKHIWWNKTLKKDLYTKKRPPPLQPGSLLYN